MRPAPYAHDCKAGKSHCWLATGASVLTEELFLAKAGKRKVEMLEKRQYAVFQCVNCGGQTCFCAGMYRENILKQNYTRFLCVKKVEVINGGASCVDAVRSALGDEAAALCEGALTASLPTPHTS